ncbi:heme lyase CcmF/NrfE family subunit [Stakelama pacifica]|uniref:Cytochrome c-type biogenesis protein CcmF n=1 Tax=Stakelama pacifica TaxID=517720 RepID=A0A4R6FU35_9SPHN|nr:heme lyase CcmF/NrfE family subunit [Stakelama pacifica]TDN84444.1 cytochrome c-type biogenesis protein CcmF [Stakelama pacifica]GGO93791.1 cytochrome c-type biogenesis protein CycK [Stakelama pacifica]
MIAETGLVLLWLAASLALLQLAMAIIGLRFDRADIISAVRPVAIVQGLLTALAMGALILLFARTDLSVLLVAENSNVAKPMLYKIAGAWGNHEGSMLLWVTILGLSGAGIALFERRLAERTLIATLGAQALISIGFFAFLLLSSNPFARIWPPPADGRGLNPLLQDPGLAFHPPTLYFGYVGLSVAFSFAVGALVMRDVTPAFARAMRPWALGAWLFLTLGITAGSYWAYYELGWGGWWFWDPVENASLMPWLAATALLHSVTVLATRDGLRAWTVMLAVVAFSMSMIGTFLVRSGVLTSVHAFAVDPERGSFLLALLALYIGGALALFALRIGSVRQGALFDPVSREAGLVLNNLLLSVILGVVLIGTLYPLVAQGMGVQLSVGKPFFDKTIGPVALILMVALAFGPLLRWRSDDPRALLRRMRAPVAAALFALGMLVPFARGISVLPLIGLILAAALAVASILPLWGRNLRRTPLFTWGMVIAHLGVAVAVAGMASESAFTRERLVALHIGQGVQVGPYRVGFAGVRPEVGDNWSGIGGVLTVSRGGETVTLIPQQRYFSDPVTTTNESAILTVADGQLYTVLGERNPDGRWQLRLWWKPLVTLIWLGGGMMALGGLLALIGRVGREWRTKRRRRRIEMGYLP